MNLFLTVEAYVLNLISTKDMKMLFKWKNVLKERKRFMGKHMFSSTYHFASWRSCT